MTTMGAMHGAERQCASCGLTYRYPKAESFVCQNCDAWQPWDVDTAKRKLSQPPPPPSHISLDQVAASELEIDLRAVHGCTNTLSNDALRRLHDQLAVLNLVDEANRWRHEQTGHFQQVKAVLANAGIRFET